MTELRELAELDGFKYEWLGQSTMRITTPMGRVIYFDPVFIDAGAPKANYILITHHHVDHCLPEFVAAIRTEKTRMAAFHDAYVAHCAKDIKGVRTVKTGETVQLGEITVTGVPAGTRRGFHMPELDGTAVGCGFVVEVEGARIYFSGDTGMMKELTALRDIDVAMVSIKDNVGYIKTEEIVEMVRAMRPRLFIPVHFTPHDAPGPHTEGVVISSKDPRFFTSPADPSALAPLFEGTGTRVALLKMLCQYELAAKG